MTSNDEYFDSVEALYEQIQSSHYHHKFKGPFVFTCAAFIEYLMNILFLDHATKTVLPNQQRKVAEENINKTLKGKIDYILRLASNQQFDFDSESIMYKSLMELKTLRNALIHNKTKNQKVNIQRHKDGSISFVAHPPKYSFSLLDNVFIDQLHKAVCAFYCDIYQAFHRPEGVQKKEYMILCGSRRR